MGRRFSFVRAVAVTYLAVMSLSASLPAGGSEAAASTFAGGSKAAALPARGSASAGAGADSLPDTTASRRVQDAPGGDEPLFEGVVDTVEVSSERPRIEDAAAAFATVHEVAEGAGRVSTLGDVIERGAGVHVRRHGGLGSYSAASIRASSPGQVEVYLDGIPLNSAMWGAVNLADIPIGSLEKVEVYRGGSPIRFGTAGMGGVVNLVTRAPGAGRATTAISAGGYGAFRLNTLRSGAAGSVDYAVAFHHLQSEGDFEYLDRHGTPENEGDDEIVERENNDFRESDLLVRVSAGLPRGWKLELSNETFDKRSGVPGIENVHIKSVHYKIFRNAARVSVSPPGLLGGSLALDLTGYHVFRRDRLYNPEDEVG
ncbi:MAG: TonB-dependent receptor plug domain-containing protein, partial [Candidatus Eisenbacteria bacterium]|nr:TonB-dependent receptor plug domain-containing protein [Candidatus Eisenbacteria bacterium]